MSPTIVTDGEVIVTAPPKQHRGVPAETAFGFQIRLARALGPLHAANVKRLQTQVSRARRLIRVMHAGHKTRQLQLQHARVHLDSLDQLLKSQDPTSAERFLLKRAINALEGE